MMKIVIAPDSFKGSLAADRVAEAIEAGLSQELSQAVFDKIPMADGGEGTLDSLVAATSGEIRFVDVLGPRGEPVKARYGITGGSAIAVVEMAEASGLTLLSPDRRNPELATTYGTGQLIKAALDSGCRRFVIAIGGSATNDGGAGAMQALGARLLDQDNNNLAPGGIHLLKLARLDISELDQRALDADFQVACDVDNPLLGPNGASRVYGPQKGASDEQVERLERALERYAEVIERDLGVSIASAAGAGAAGGFGAGLIAFLNARLNKGVELVAESLGLADRLKDADLVITGEGEINDQTVCGKVPYGVARLAKAFSIPVIAVTGNLGRGWQVVLEEGINCVIPVCSGPMTLEESMRSAYSLIEMAGKRIGQLLSLQIS